MLRWGDDDMFLFSPFLSLAIWFIALLLRGVYGGKVGWLEKSEGIGLACFLFLDSASSRRL